MGGFVLAALGLVVVTLAMLLRPWQRRAGERSATAAEVHASLYRDQLAELDRDLAAGTIASADHAQARSELQRRLLDDTATGPAAPRPTPGKRVTRWLIALALPLAAGGLYTLLGAPQALLAPPADASAAHTATAAEIETMVARLAARLERNPADPKGWAMLARSYRALGRFAPAQAAYARIGDDLHRDPVLLAEYADVIATQDGGQLEGRPLQLVMAALAIDPNQPMALSLAATAAYRRQDFPQAARHWQRLLSQLPPDSDDARFLVKTLAEIGAPATPAPSATPAPAPATTAAAAVSGTVTLAPGLQSLVRPDDTVFVFARATAGSRVPLAVQRARVADLPLQFRLDDSSAMSPQTKLSGAAEVRVEARVSRSGNATPAAGDLIALGEVVPTGRNGVAIQIDRVRP